MPTEPISITEGSEVWERVPLDLHGHQKKLRFIYSAIEKYRLAHSVPRSEVRVLEVGCSNGRNITTPLAAAGYAITGIDIHGESIEYARRNTRFANARFLCQNLSDLPAAERFDIVILSDVLEHVDDPAWLCERSIRHLKPEGLVLISIPNGYGPYELELRFLTIAKADRLIANSIRAMGRLLKRPSSLAGRPLGGPAYNYDSGHVQFFHLTDFYRLLDRVGLKVEEKANGALFGGTLSSLVFGRFRRIVTASLKVADWLPQRWVTTWYFSCSARERRPAEFPGK